MHDRHSLHNSRRVFLRWLAGQGLTGVFPRLAVSIPRTAEVSQIEHGRTTHASKTAITLFLCGDVMTGRGIDQALPHPGDPRLHEPYVGDAREYVQLAEAASGPIDAPVDFAYIWGDALVELERRNPDIRPINLETAVTDNDDHWRGKAIHYRMHPRNLPAISAAAIHCCTLANNHVLDWGYQGLADTLRSLHRAGIATAGAGNDLQEACAPATLDVPRKGRVIVFRLGHGSSGIPKRSCVGYGNCSTGRVNGSEPVLRLPRTTHSTCTGTPNEFRGERAMKMRMQTFGEIEVEGERYDYDLVIEQGRIRKRRKKPSRAYRERYGHTPLSVEEAIPWHGKQLFIGTGMYGKLPVMSEVYAAAEKERIEVVALPTPELCGKLLKLKSKEVNAVLHVTC